MAKKKDIIRVGDKVKIIQPRFIYRCGWGEAQGEGCVGVQRVGA